MNMKASTEAIPRRQAGKRQTWKDLAVHYKEILDVHLRQLFAEDPKRGERLTVEALGLFLDYSKNRITDETRDLLIQLAEESHLQERIDAMFRGERINLTENRAVLHTVLHAPRDTSIVVDGENVVPKVHAVLDRMRTLPTACAVGSGRGTPANAFATWLTSVSAVPILGRSWLTRL
jgi:glucose-6-phosphate isomerase